MISVIIPLYNKENNIEKTVDSVLRQTYIDFELLIVDDGSTDNSLEVVQKINDPRIRILSKENGGVSSARNLGIKESNYDYIAFLDADDLWTSVHLEEIFKLISFKNDIHFYATSFTKNKVEFARESSNSTIEIIENFYLEESFSRTVLSSSSFAFKKSLLENLDYLYDENLKYGEDVEFWYRILKHQPLVYSNLVTTLYNIEGENRSDNIAVVTYLRLFKHHTKLPYHCILTYI